jgi:signal peptidase I
LADTARPRRFLFEYAQAAVIALMFALFVRTYLVQAFRIPSPSMEDSLLIGDHILVNKFSVAPLALSLERAVLPIGPLRRGDVVVFRPPHDPGQDYIKRVIGLPNETIEMINQVVYVKDPGEEGFTALLEPYATHKDPEGVPPNLNDFPAATIPEGEYFLMGDNRDNSFDSREWGTVPRRSISGRALIVYWSFDGADPNGALAAAREKSSQVKRILSGFTALFRGSRWERTGQPIR